MIISPPNERQYLDPFIVISLHYCIYDISIDISDVVLLFHSVSGLGFAHRFFRGKTDIV